MIAYAWVGPVRRSLPTASRLTGRKAEQARADATARSPRGENFLAALLDAAAWPPAHPRPGDEPMTPETGVEALRVAQERIGAGLYYEDWPRATAAYTDRDRPGACWR